jgi:DNA invertase Pin-like site-specific DNA recombinase
MRVRNCSFWRNNERLKKDRLREPLWLERGCSAERRRSVVKLAAEGVTRAVIATKLGIGDATVYRILAVAKEQNP